MAKMSRQYTEFLRSTCWYKHAHEGSSREMSYLTHGLTGEAGEFGDFFKKIIREVGFEDDEAFTAEVNSTGNLVKLVGELGDTLWYLTRLADVLGLTLEDIMVLNTAKLFHRLKHFKKINSDAAWPLPDHTHDGALTVALFTAIKNAESQGIKT